MNTCLHQAETRASWPPHSQTLALGTSVYMCARARVCARRGRWEGREGQEHVGDSASGTSPQSCACLRARLPHETVSLYVRLAVGGGGVGE